MSPDVRRAYDEATVILLRATSDRDALHRADDEEHHGTPVYDQPGRLRWDHRVCAFTGCLTPFVVPVRNTCQRYCSPHCQAAAWYDEHSTTSKRAARRAAALAVVARRAERPAPAGGARAAVA